MQNRYTGDIGDFGKLGLLRVLQATGLSLGVNWYLVPDEIHNNDGRHIQYLENENFRKYDERLWLGLCEIVNSGKRIISSLQKDQILSAIFYPDPLDFNGKSKQERITTRKEWHEKALHALSGLDLVFLDPDNGLLVPSATGTIRENKYVKVNEISDYFHQGSSVVYYQHKARKPNAFYIEQHRQLVESLDSDKEASLGIKFIKTSQRYYFFIAHTEHKEMITRSISCMLSSAWNDCFESLSML